MYIKANEKSFIKRNATRMVSGKVTRVTSDKLQKYIIKVMLHFRTCKNRMHISYYGGIYINLIYMDDILCTA